jgi:hypothetical protein
VRLANGISPVCAGLAPASVALLLSGCVTTQQVAARARLVDARIRASQEPLRLTQRNPDVSVTRLSLVRGPAGTAVAVALRDTSARSLTDLPIAVGVMTLAGRKLYLNRAANLDYFDSHVAALAPRRVVMWVFTSARRLAVTGRPFAEVGVSQLAAPPAGALPQIEVTRERTGSRSGERTGSRSGERTLRLSVANRSGIPQYGLQVDAVALRRGADVAAGRATVPHLGTHGTATLRLTLLGSLRGATVSLSALPTIFQ